MCYKVLQKVGGLWIRVRWVQELDGGAMRPAVFPTQGRAWAEVEARLAGSSHLPDAPEVSDFKIELDHTAFDAVEVSIVAHRRVFDERVEGPEQVLAALTDPDCSLSWAVYAHYWPELAPRFAGCMCVADRLDKVSADALANRLLIKIDGLQVAA